MYLQTAVRKDPPTPRVCTTKKGKTVQYWTYGTLDIQLAPTPQGQQQAIYFTGTLTINIPNLPQQFNLLLNWIGTNGPGQASNGIALFIPPTLLTTRTICVTVSDHAGTVYGSLLAAV